MKMWNKGLGKWSYEIIFQNIRDSNIVMAMKGLMDGTDINFVNLAWLICLNLLEVPRIFQTHSYKKKKLFRDSK